jgi:Zinc knuckle
MTSDFNHEPNMSTIASNSDQLIARLLPEKYRKEDNIETFIAACSRYFKVAKTPESIQEILIIGLLSHELVPVYENVSVETKGYEARLREAFQKKSSLMEDLMEAVNFERTNESAEEYFAKAKKLAAKLAKHNWSEEEIEKNLLIHGSKYSDVKKEIKFREVKEIKEVKNVIKKVDEVREMERPVHAMRASYKDVVKRGSATGGIMKKEDTFVRRHPGQNNISCWNCKETGHRRSECKRERKITCHACGEEGHVRRECRKVRCARCNNPGHRAEECYTNLNKRYQGRTDYQRRTQGDSRRFSDAKTRSSGNRNSDDYRRGFERGRQIAMMEKEEYGGEREPIEKNESCRDDEEPILALE